MSYDLGFWREAEDAALDDEEVYRRLCMGDEVEGVEELQADDLVKGFEAVLPRHERVGLSTWSDGESSFSVYSTSQHVRVDGSGLSGEQLRLLIAVAAEHGCLAYDPQSGERIEAV